MRRVAYVRRGARAGICVLALGVSAASAQQPAAESAPQNIEQSAPAATESESGTPAEAAGAQATPPGEAATSVLPELVVNDDGKRKKKVAKAKREPVTAPVTSTGDAEADKPPQGVTMGTAAPADTGTTIFDANAVNVRSNGAGDANSFLRNLPGVQYQNQAGNNGSTSQSAIDTKPEEVSISGARTYENNIIVNGVSVNNIAGNQERPGSALGGRTTTNVDGTSLYGGSAQTVFVPAEFVGEATVIDSNASAQYGQFLGGVVIYDLAAPPTDRYRASVSVTKESSDYASYILMATPTATALAAPTYEKNKLSVSLGAPITPDFAFIAQASRLEAESGKPRDYYIGGMTDEYSDNMFMRFAATARTDFGKITLDTSRTDYSQHWESYRSIPGRYYLDQVTETTSTKLEHQINLPSIRADGIGLGAVKAKTWAYYNDSTTANNSPGSVMGEYVVQRVTGTTSGGPWTGENFHLPIEGCPGVDNLNDIPTGGPTYMYLPCLYGGVGNLTQNQVDFGVSSIVDGRLLYGSFTLGAELKRYDVKRSLPEDYYSSVQTVVLNNGIVYGSPSPPAQTPVNYTEFNCAGAVLCDSTQFSSLALIGRAYDAAVQINAVHTFAEIDQTFGWLNVRAGARLDYDDYQKNYNVAPRLAATITPFEGVSITGGFNQYYLGETAYYALRAKTPVPYLHSRTVDANGNVSSYNVTPDLDYEYRMGDLATPYDDEFTGALKVRDPLLNGEWRLKYLERYGRDQYATETCDGAAETTQTRCWNATNGGETSYREATAAYTKAWSGLQNAFELDAAAVTGSVTWSERSVGGSTYLVNNDIRGDGGADLVKIKYNGEFYRPEEFDVVTGNLDIPVRFGGTISTRWFDGLLELNASAAVDLAYQGVRWNKISTRFDPQQGAYIEYEDARLKTTLKLDVSAKVNVTENAYVEAFVDNITNSDQNLDVTTSTPWVLGRTFWVGSGLRF